MFHLQFVEIKNADRHTELLEGDRHIVGHKGDIVPRLCNGRISQRHATIARIGRQWLVVDGHEGKPSTNGLWTIEGRIYEGMLANVGDRIYLMRDIDSATECYLEVVSEPSRPTTKQPDRSTVGFQQQLVAIDEAVHVNRDSIGAVQAQLGEAKTQLGETERKVEFVIDTLEHLGKNWKLFVLGGLTASFLAGAGITAIAVYTHLDQVFDRIFPAQSK